MLVPSGWTPREVDTLTLPPAPDSRTLAWRACLAAGRSVTAEAGGPGGHGSPSPCGVSLGGCLLAHRHGGSHPRGREGRRAQGGGGRCPGPVPPSADAVPAVGVLGTVSRCACSPTLHREPARRALTTGGPRPAAPCRPQTVRGSGEGPTVSLTASEGAAAHLGPLPASRAERTNVCHCKQRGVSPSFVTAALGLHALCFREAGGRGTQDAGGGGRASRRGAALRPRSRVGLTELRTQRPSGAHGPVPACTMNPNPNPNPNRLGPSKEMPAGPTPGCGLGLRSEGAAASGHHAPRGHHRRLTHTGP